MAHRLSTMIHKEVAASCLRRTVRREGGGGRDEIGAALPRPRLRSLLSYGLLGPTLRVVGEGTHAGGLPCAVPGQGTAGTIIFVPRRSTGCWGPWSGVLPGSSPGREAVQRRGGHLEAGDAGLSIGSAKPKARAFRPRSQSKWQLIDVVERVQLRRGVEEPGPPADGQQRSVHGNGTPYPGQFSGFDVPSLKEKEKETG